MERFENALRAMKFEFFGKSMHRVMAEAFFDKKETAFVDLRSPEERQVAPLPLEGLTRTMQIPLAELPDRYQEVPREGLVGLFCSTDTRSSIAMAYLRAQGYENIRIVAGGYPGLAEQLKPGKILKRLAE